MKSSTNNMTSNATRPTVMALALCAASDLAAVPLLLSASGNPPAAVGVLVGVVGLATIAVVFLARSRPSRLATCPAGPRPGLGQR